MYKFMLLAGGHIGPDAKGVERRWQAGDVIETNQNLMLLNGREGQRKFDLVDNNSGIATIAPKRKVVDLGVMSLDQLLAFAAEEELPLPAEDSTKEEVLAHLREVMANG